MEWLSNYRIEILEEIEHQGKKLAAGRWIHTNEFQKVLDQYGDKVRVIDMITKLPVTIKTEKKVHAIKDKQKKENPPQ